MKKLLYTIGFLLAAAAADAQTARVQVIHNSADALAAEVDVYLGSTLIVDNFAFRTATSFVDLPAGLPIDIGIAPGTSTSSADVIATFTYTLSVGETYVIVANGLLNPAAYNPFEAFNLYVYPIGREAAMNANETDVLVFHGATDAPGVDVVVPGAGTIVPNATYGDFAGYFELGTADYTLNIQPTGSGTTIASYQAPLATLGLDGAALVVVASGFLDPSANSNGPAFGLWAALPSGGGLVELPTSDSRIQVIHNSADAAAEEVDVYINGTLALDNFAFRTATPFISVPAEVALSVAIAPATSTSVADAIATFPYNLEANETYVIVASGIVSATGYTPATGFDLYVYNMGREEAMNANETDVLVFHGATDAPGVDVVVPGAGTIVPNATYGDFAGYLELATADYTLNIQPAGSGTTIASYQAPLATLGLDGEALVVVASGFLDPSANSNGPAFGLWAALPSGGALVELPTSESRIQVIHNSADAAAEEVDVYINGDLALDNFAFRTATPFISVPAEVALLVAIAPATSTSVADAIATFPYNLEANETYVIVANGIVSATGYTPATGFDLYVYATGREEAMNANETDVLVFHGATDAPMVDVQAVSAGTIVNDISYGEFDGYLELPTADYVLNVTDASGSTVVASYLAPLATLNLQGDALVVVASGFLNPSVNSNGAGFGLWAALPSGGNLIPLPISTSIQENNVSQINVFPNPANDQITVQLGNDLEANANIEILDITGAVVSTIGSNGKNRVELNVTALAAGSYMARVIMGNEVQTIRFQVIR